MTSASVPSSHHLIYLCFLELVEIYKEKKDSLVTKELPTIKVEEEEEVNIDEKKDVAQETQQPQLPQPVPHQQQASQQPPRTNSNANSTLEQEMFGTAMDAVKFLDSIEFEILLFCAFCGEIDFTELTAKNVWLSFLLRSPQQPH